VRRAFSALRHRNYRLYWSGQVVSLIGTWMQSVSQPWLVLELGGTPLQVGTVVALQFLPSLFITPFAGVLADRVDRRRLLIITQSLAMLQATTLFVLAFSGVVEIWQIQLLAFGLGLINAVDMPVRQSFAAVLVPKADLTNAIALSGASFNLGRVIGPAIAGVTLALYGSAFNFGLNAVSYLAVLAGLLLMDPAGISRTVVSGVQATVMTSLGEGVRYARGTGTVLWSLVLLGGMSMFAMNFQTLLPIYARQTLEVDAGGYGALFAIMGLGSLMGSLTLAAMGDRRPRLRLILGGGTAFVAFEIALGLTSTVGAAYALIAAIGLSSMLMLNTINATVQHSVPNELRGRVMALYVTVLAGVGPLGGLFAGALAQWRGAPAALVVGASIAAVFVVIAAFGYGVFRKPAPLPA
jgi:MFS family permease